MCRSGPCCYFDANFFEAHHRFAKAYYKLEIGVVGYADVTGQALFGLVCCTLCYLVFDGAALVGGSAKMCCNGHRKLG